MTVFLFKWAVPLYLSNLIAPKDIKGIDIRFSFILLKWNFSFFEGHFWQEQKKFLPLDCWNWIQKYFLWNDCCREEVWHWYDSRAQTSPAPLVCRPSQLLRCYGPSEVKLQAGNSRSLQINVCKEHIFIEYMWLSMGKLKTFKQAVWFQGKSILQIFIRLNNINAVELRNWCVYLPV